MSHFKIEKNVPTPTSRNRYPFAEMEIGDSILGKISMYNAARQHGRRYGRKFASRKQTNGDIRIWRVS